MKIEFDPNKDRKNIAKHGVSLQRAEDFDYDTAKIKIDNRRDYGEIRYSALGYLYGRLHMLCYVEMKTGLRAISLRKANARERKRYEKEKLH